MSTASRRLFTVALSAALAALPGVASAHSSTAHWASTHTRALQLDEPLLGAAPAQMRLDLSVALPLRNHAQVDRLIQERTILSKADARRRFGPSAASVATVKRYLASEGFSHLKVAPDRLLISGSATVAQAEHAFNTSLSLFRVDGHTVYANTRAAAVPRALAGKVSAVLGLQSFPMALPTLKTGARSATTPADAGSPDLTGFTPKAVQHAYQADTMPAATGTETAIIAAGDMTPTLKDLRDAEKHFGYPEVPVNVIPDSPYSTRPDNPLTGSLEWALDTQYSTMIASTPQATVKALDIYDIGTFTDSEVARGINMFVSDDRASALSISLGECDVLAFVDGAMIASDNELALGALQGQSSFASTGDNGYACPEVASTGVPEGPPGDSWPAVGEYTTGAGGTTLLADSDGNVQEEIGWLGSGGGVDPYEAAGPWTLQANPFGQAWQYTNQGGRSIPDISAVADGNTPVLVYSGGSETGVGGTSVASPVLEGLWDRVNDTSGTSFGLAQYDFYALYDQTNPATLGTSPIGSAYYVPNPNPGPVPGLRDITLGTNGGCVGTPGWDVCTGVGVPQAADMAKALAKLPLPPTGHPGRGAAPDQQAGSTPASAPAGSPSEGGVKGYNHSSAPSKTRAKPHHKRKKHRHHKAKKRHRKAAKKDHRHAAKKHHRRHRKSHRH